MYLKENEIRGIVRRLKVKRVSMGNGVGTVAFSLVERIGPD